MRQENYDNIKKLLDRWAEWMTNPESLAEGAPRESPGAPDARIHSFEDMEIANDKILVGAVNACVDDLEVMEKTAVMMHYGLMECRVWRAEFTTLFDMAIASLYTMLRARIVC